MSNPREVFATNLKTLRHRIETACTQSSRLTTDVQLMAVTKRFPLDIARMATKEGLHLLGENRVQEAVEKIAHADFDARWELIGHLQSNKAQIAAQYFDAIQSLDSVKLANRLNRFSSELGKTLPVLIQVNTGNDPGKSGFAVNTTEAALESILELSSIKVEGFMTIAPLPADLDTAKAAFSELRSLRDRISQVFGLPLPSLSMGMSFDLEAAIEAGSTCIRVGSALFGERPI
jgi:PLP dependent protein